MFAHRISKDVCLRLLQMQHAPELFRVTDSNRAHLREWLPWLDHIKEEKDSAAFISSALRSLAVSSTFACGIWNTGELCGVIGYNMIDWESRIAFPGYWLAKSAEGKGIMTACCQALVEHAFTEYRLNRVVITIATENHKSQAITDRLGFKREGVLRDAEWLYDHYVDHTVNALLNKTSLRGRRRVAATSPRPSGKAETKAA